MKLGRVLIRMPCHFLPSAKGSSHRCSQLQLNPSRSLHFFAGVGERPAQDHEHLTTAIHPASVFPSCQLSFPVRGPDVASSKTSDRLKLKMTIPSAVFASLPELLRCVAEQVRRPFSCPWCMPARDPQKKMGLKYTTTLTPFRSTVAGN